MRTSILTATIVLLLVGAGCAALPTAIPVSTPIASTSPAVLSTSSIPSYSDWAISDNESVRLAAASGQDCVMLELGSLAYGELLSTLVHSPKLRTEWKLSEYTVPYVKNLDSIISHFAQNKYRKKLFAFTVCNLGEDIDVVTGVLGDPYQSRVENNEKLTRVWLRNGDEVHELAVERIFDATAFGGDVDPCQPILINSQIQWSCFMGPITRGGNNPAEIIARTKDGKYKSWVFDFNGKFLRNEEWVAPLENKP